MRFSIRWLLISVAYIGLGVAALQNPNPAHQWVRLVTLGILLSAISCMLYAQKDQRPFWVGFSLYGWFYVAFVLWHGGWDHPVTSLHMATMRGDPITMQHRVDVGTWLPMPIIAWIGGAISQAIYRSAKKPDDA